MDGCKSQGWGYVYCIEHLTVLIKPMLLVDIWLPTINDNTCVRFSLLHSDGQKWGVWPPGLEDRPMQVEVSLDAAGKQVPN